MSRADAVQAVGRLLTAFRQEVSPATVEIYAEHLADIPPDLLTRTVASLLDSQKFFPAIAEIRERAASLAGLLPPTPAEAQAIVRHADVALPVYRRDGSLAYMDSRWEWSGVDSETRELIRDVLEKVGDPREADGNPRFGWDNGFAKTYEKVAEVVKMRVLANLPAALATHARNQLTSGQRVRELIEGGEATR